LDKYSKWDHVKSDLRLQIYNQNFVSIAHNFFPLLLGFMTNAMRRMHWMQWMVDCWMEGSSVSKWLVMEDHRLLTVVIAVGGGGYMFNSSVLYFWALFLLKKLLTANSCYFFHVWHYLLFVSCWS